MNFQFNLIFGLCSIFGFGQNEKVDIKILPDISVNYQNSNLKDDSVAFLINGKTFPSTLMRTINPNVIKNINIVEESKLYPNGGIDLEIDKSIIIEPISLKDLIKKYTSVKTDLNIFLVNNEPIELNSAIYFVDKNNISNIIVTAVKNVDMPYNLIKIFTKSNKIDKI